MSNARIDQVAERMCPQWHDSSPVRRTRYRDLARDALIAVEELGYVISRPVNATGWFSNAG